MKLHPNIAIVRRFYNSFAAGDTQTLWQISGENLGFHVPGRNPWAGTYRGREQVLDLYMRVGKEIGHSLRLEVHDIVGGEDHVVGLHRVTASMTGRKLDVNGVATCHVRSGTIEEMWLGWQSQRAFDEFWS